MQQLTQDRAALVQQRAAMPPVPDAAAIAQGKQAELAPAQAAASAAMTDAANTKPPGPAELPAAPNKPVVDPKEYQKLSWGLLGMALIAGSVSKNWYGASASLNGALKGFLEGNQEKAANDWKKYQADFDAAIKKHDQQQQDYLDTMQSKKLTINQMLTELSWKAAKWDDQALAAQVRQKSLDAINQRIDSFDIQRAKLEDDNEKVKLAVDKALADKVAGSAPASEGAVGMAASGAPLNQIVPGYGKAAAAERAKVRDAAIAQIQKEVPGLSAMQAGQLYAKRQVEYQAGKVSTVQLTKMEGATRQALEQLDFNIDKTTEEMKKLKSTNISPIINAIMRQEEQWSGDPALAGLFYFMNASATESARLLSGGQASAAQLHQGAAEEAQKWANVNLTPASWAEVSKSMKEEGTERLKTYQNAIAAGEGNFGDTGGAGGPPGKRIKVDDNGVPIG
jgi:hypothetical protein